MANTLGDAARNAARSNEKNPRQKRDTERLRQALQQSTSTQHVIVPASRNAENEQQNRLRRAAVPQGRKLNANNNAAAKKAAKTMSPQATKSTLLQSGVGIKTTEAFGVKPLQLI
jgi:hypothetical protein